MKPLIGTAKDEASLAGVAETVRARVAFYLLTPTYRPTFELLGWGDIARHASQLSRAQQWDDLPGLVSDEMLHTVATVATHHRIAKALVERYATRVDRIEFSIPVRGPEEGEALRAILTDIRELSASR